MISRIWIVLLLFAAGCSTAPPPGVRPVTSFESERYLGTWFEIARLDNPFERGLSKVTAEYTKRKDGGVDVLNRGHDAETGQWKEAKGKAYFRQSTTVGSFRVTFFSPFYAGYHVIALDDNYEYALVSGSTLDYLWVLSRSPDLEIAVYSALVEHARSLGYPVDSLIKVAQEVSEEEQTSGSEDRP